MKVKLKPLNEQVVFVVGASSGIGLRVAELAAEKGAKVVLVARSEEALQEAVVGIQAKGGQAISVAADVVDEHQLRRAAKIAVDSYGTIDSWVHIAGVGVWGLSEQIPIEDARQLFEINFWGLVHGTKIAREILRDNGGALINMGSVESERAIPYHSFYAASKHAVKGYTEGVRQEIEKEGLPISVTLIKPASINTPFAEHARNYMPDASPRLLPPVYDPDIVAKAILTCCVTPYREVTIGSSGRVMEVLERFAPRLLDRILEFTAFAPQRRHDQPVHYADSFHQPAPNQGYVRGLHDGYVQKTSLTTYARLHPFSSSLIAGGVLGLATVLWRAYKGESIAPVQRRLLRKAHPRQLFSQVKEEILHSTAS